MLKIIIPAVDLYDDTTEQFLSRDELVLELEHSLVSLSKWESIFEKPLLGAGEKTAEEVLAYAECMILTPNFPPGVSTRFTDENINAINEYINLKRSATWFSELQAKPKSREVITSELVYYWMIAFQIPFSCETWHINRLFTLIKLCDIKNSKPKRMTPSEIAQRNRELNAQRKKELGTTG